MPDEDVDFDSLFWHGFLNGIRDGRMERELRHVGVLCESLRISWVRCAAENRTLLKSVATRGEGETKK